MYISDAITESEVTYDQKFKQLFRNKKFLAPILKNVVKEYAALPLELIEGLIVSVKGDETVATNVEAEDVGRDDEVKTYYDVLIACRLPGTGDMLAVDLYFDLEMQREKDPGYPVVKRGIYYCSRMLSRQLTNVKNADYGELKPVYSVWIMINHIPKILQNSRYDVCLSGASSLTGNYDSFSSKDKKSFDAAMEKLAGQIGLVHLCLIYLSEDYTESGGTGDTLIRYMQSVFMKQVGNPAYNPYAEYSRDIDEEVNDIMTIVGMFAEIAEKRGEERGEKRGEERGEERGEKRGEIRIMNLLQYLEEQGREEEIHRLITAGDKEPLLEKLYAEFNL